jgi:hypothetical protein
MENAKYEYNHGAAGRTEMRDRTRESFGRFLNIPDYAMQPSRAAATNEKPRFEYRLMHADPAGFPNSADMEAIACLSDDNSAFVGQIQKLTKPKRKNLYTLWFRANRQCFLMLERIPSDENGVAIVGSTIILPLTIGTFNRIKEGQLAVTDLRKEDICDSRLSHDVLLFDTWVLHNDYQEPRFFARKRHYGFGNAMVLKHVSMFLNAESEPSLTLYAEPDSVSMRDILLQIGFQARGETKIGEPLLELIYPSTGDETVDNMGCRQQIESLITHIDQVRSW